MRATFTQRLLMVYLFSRHDNSTFKTHLTEGMLHSILVTDPLPCTAISSLCVLITPVFFIVTIDLLLMLRTIPPICKIRTARITARSFWFLWHKYHLQYKSRCRYFPLAALSSFAFAILTLSQRLTVLNLILLYCFRNLYFIQRISVKSENIVDTVSQLDGDFLPAHIGQVP